MTEKKFILASGSPRRLELLKNAGYDFEVVVSDADESLPDGIGASQAVESLARVKALSVAKKYAESVVLGCDTVVALDGKILGKPRGKDEAFNMLRLLSGRSHTVYTGVCVTNFQTTRCFVSTTDVEFYELSDETINSYIDTGDPMDKAGAYGIQGFGSVLVKRIDGDFFTVMGLPVSESARLLADFGIYGTVKLN